MHILDHPVIRQMTAANIPFHVDEGEVIVEGFSKSGTARLTMDGDQLMCQTRYENNGPIDHLDDLVGVAHKWWVKYRDQNVFAEPSYIWLPHFIRKGWIEVHTETRTTYRPL